MSKTPSNRLNNCRRGRRAVDQAVDQDLVDLAAEPGQGQAGPDEHGPVKLVEVPLVDQEAINAAEPLGRPGRAQSGRNEVREAGRSIIEQAQANPRPA